MRYLVPAGRTFDISDVRASTRARACRRFRGGLARVSAPSSVPSGNRPHAYGEGWGGGWYGGVVVENPTAGRRAPARLVHTYHGHVLDGYFSTLAARGFTAMERILGQQEADALIAVSPRVREDLWSDTG